MTHDDSRMPQTNAETTPDDALARALARFGRRMRRTRAADAEPIESMSAPAFRMLVAERLRTLERDVAEVRARVNGLLFVVAGAVVTQLVLRLTT